MAITAMTLTKKEVQEILEDPRNYDAGTYFWDGILRDYPEEDELKRELRHRWYLAEKRECY